MTRTALQTSAQITDGVGHAILEQSTTAKHAPLRKGASVLLWPWLLAHPRNAQQALGLARRQAGLDVVNEAILHAMGEREPFTHDGKSHTHCLRGREGTSVFG